MKRIPLLLLLILPLLFSACEEDDSPMVQPVTFDVIVKYSSAYDGQVAPSVTVKALNLDSKVATEATTNAVGVARFENLPVGVYDLSVSQTYTPAQFFDFSGQTVENDVVFNATLTNQTINTASAKVYNLELRSSPVGNLVIKQVYYTGSDTKDGASFRDHFIEIYNNSDQVQYADGLGFGQLFGVVTVPTGSPSYILPSGQFDWSKAEGMPSNINANADYVYTKSLFQIPGSGTQYPIEPGKSIIIAQNAINHKAPYQNQAGTTITPIDPSLTVDLSGADFEAYYGQNFASDLDNPAVPNLILHQTYGKDMLFDTFGRESYILFKAEQPITTLPEYKSPENKNETKYKQVPNSWIIDAVEAQQSPSKLSPKRLVNELDAGYTYTPLGTYSSQAIIRKVAKTFNGRNILQDTNNSTNDFKVIDRAAPRGF